ncbi:hypothetical protein EG328_004041 [Venturia inaequalis]|uniref:Uncharacterized protein n=1 Tax=Venturia inaequalis TaxID=5025 RepID=A0A8H3URJ6_VENIN|nr:hypothetical protein EG328_004041 [Venturia inaequalis]
MAPTSPPIPESKILKSRDPADNDENNRALTGEQYTSSPQHVHGLNITMENGLSIPKSKTLRSRDPDDNDENNRALIGEQHTSSPQHVHGLNITTANGVVYLSTACPRPQNHHGERATNPREQDSQIARPPTTTRKTGP